MKRVTRAVGRELWAVSVLVIFLSLMAQGSQLTAAFACPSCKEAISGQDPLSLQLTQGYARSIALLMGAPYLLFAGMALWVGRSIRRTKKTARV